MALLQVNPRFPLVIAANREESRARPSTPPHRWPGEPVLSGVEGPVVWAGRDEVAGGTWLGVNSAGLLAAITNRRVGPSDPARPSRGGLCSQALREPSLTAALQVVRRQLEAHRYNPFNLLCANGSEGWVVTWPSAPARGEPVEPPFDKAGPEHRRRLRVSGVGFSAVPLKPGVHVVTNRGDPDDDQLPVVRRARALLRPIDLAAPSLENLLADLGRVCADTRGRAPLCRPGRDRGTVSSSLIALDANGRIAAYRHAEGPPSEVPYEVVRIGR